MKPLQNNSQTVLSASRRTDIPAFYMEWFMSGLKKGLFTIHHPFHGGQLTLKKDYGQRIKRGCECNTSRDVGDYVCHPCLHQCLYCYANK